MTASAANRKRLLKNSKLWHKRLGILQVTDSKPDVIELRALMSARNSSEAFDLRCYVRENLLKYMPENMPGNLPQKRHKGFGGSTAAKRIVPVPDEKNS